MREREYLLQRRLDTATPGAPRPATQNPASYVTFDQLAAETRDLRDLPWRQRRRRLEAVADRDPPHGHPAAGRLDVLGGGRQLHSRYLPGQRDWVTIKRRQTVQVVVGGVTGSLTGAALRGSRLVRGRTAEDTPGSHRRDVTG